MPHRGANQPSGNIRQALMRTPNFVSQPGTLHVITLKELIDWASASLVIISGGLAGHYAAAGMTPVQWAGAAVAVLGSVTIAVAVRVWPTGQSQARQGD
jgi:hypothetical protein